MASVLKVYEGKAANKKVRVLAHNITEAKEMLQGYDVKFVDNASAFSATRKCRWSVYGEFQYFQPNDKDPKNSYGDCVYRALCATLDKNWLEVFDELLPVARELQCPMEQEACYEKLLEGYGFTKHTTKAVKGEKRMTVVDFAKEHPTGRFFVGVASHVTSVIDGIIYDSWNCGDKVVYSWYEK